MLLVYAIVALAMLLPAGFLAFMTIQRGATTGTRVVALGTMATLAISTIVALIQRAKRQARAQGMPPLPQ